MKEWRIDKYRIFITDSTLQVFESFNQVSTKNPESGGILLGQIIGNEIFVLKASIPNKFDRSGRFKFERNSEIAQILVNHEFINSGNKTIYLGEWHTHAEHYPSPSSIDKKMIKDQYNENILNEPFLLMVIKGFKDLFVSIYDGKSINKCIVFSGE